MRNQDAITNHLAYVEFLQLLVEDELTRRRDLLFQRRMKQAQMPPPKSPDEFDWGFNPKTHKQHDRQRRAGGAKTASSESVAEVPQVTAS